MAPRPEERAERGEVLEIRKRTSHSAARPRAARRGDPGQNRIPAESKFPTEAKKKRARSPRGRTFQADERARTPRRAGFPGGRVLKNSSGHRDRQGQTDGDRRDRTPDFPHVSPVIRPNNCKAGTLPLSYVPVRDEMGNFTIYQGSKL